MSANFFAVCCKNKKDFCSYEMYDTKQGLEHAYEWQLGKYSSWCQTYSV